MEDDELLACFVRGLIPGPTESEDDFLHRVQAATSLSQPEWEEVAEITLPLFGFAVDWVSLRYCSHRLAWWEGAATWIGEEGLPSIQLRPAFEKGSYLGYRRSDVLAHEALHAARMRFDEPIFEEMLAYATSTQRWKRFLGPAFRRGWEPLVLLLALCAGIYQPWVPLLFFSAGFAAFFRRHIQFQKCLSKLSLPIVLCLTDDEIIRCAKGSIKEMVLEWEDNKKPRTRLIRRLLASLGDRMQRL